MEQPPSPRARRRPSRALALPSALADAITMRHTKRRRDTCAKTMPASAASSSSHHRPAAQPAWTARGASCAHHWHAASDRLTYKLVGTNGGPHGSRDLTPLPPAANREHDERRAAAAAATGLAVVDSMPLNFICARVGYDAAHAPGKARS